MIIYYYRQIFLRSNDFTEWIFTFVPTFQTISKNGWIELFFYHFSGAALGFEIDGAKSNLVSKIGVISGS